MERKKLIKIITEIDDPNNEVDTARVMEAYHKLDDLDEPYLDQLIDDYILDKLDARRKMIFEEHLNSCESCRKDLATMSVFVKGVKELGDEIL